MRAVLLAVLLAGGAAADASPPGVESPAGRSETEALSLVPTPIEGGIDGILVEKAERRLSLLSRGEVVRSYRIALGGNPVDPKQQEGDERTPEGVYEIDARKADSEFHLALHISYPNEEDRRRAADRGVDPGGAIMIHGLPEGWGWMGAHHTRLDWTDGCIAVTNQEIEEIWARVPDGTPIEIRP